MNLASIIVLCIVVGLFGLSVVCSKNTSMGISVQQKIEIEDFRLLGGPAKYLYQPWDNKSTQRRIERA